MKKQYTVNYDFKRHGKRHLPGATPPPTFDFTPEEEAYYTRPGGALSLVDNKQAEASATELTDDQLDAAVIQASKLKKNDGKKPLQKDVEEILNADKKKGEHKIDIHADQLDASWARITAKAK